MLHSATKSFTGTAAGLAIGEGLFTLDDRVVSFFPQYVEADGHDNLHEMRVRDLLTMTSGHNVLVSGKAWRPIKASWVPEFLKIPVAAQPGKLFCYSSAPSYMLSAIVQRTAGQSIHEYLRQRLFNVLNVDGESWESDSTGVNSGGNGLSLAPEDFLKFGILYCQGGMWEGTRILPAQWVKEATAMQVRHPITRALGEDYEPQALGYGYHFWMGPHDSYYASGIFGQYCVVMPDRNTVLAINSGVGGDRTHEVLGPVWSELYGAINVDSPSSGMRSDALTVGSPLVTMPTSLDAPIASEISGEVYQMTPNEEGVREVSIHFESDRCVVAISDDRGRHQVLCGIGQWLESPTSVSGSALHHGYEFDTTTVVACGAWSSVDEFTMTWSFIESAFRDTVVCRFVDDQLELNRSVNVNTGSTVRPTLRGKSQGSKL